MLRVGLTGGIGSGKTTVCRVFEAVGVPVYDSDERAKALMNSDAGVIADIKSLLGGRSYNEAGLDRAYVASRVFTDKRLLAGLNAAVHPAVMEDFRQWAAAKEKEGVAYVVQEAAILFEAGFDRLMDYSVTVSAPLEQRVARAAARDSADPDKIRERIGNQMTDSEREAKADYVIFNEDGDLVVPQVLKLHKIFSDEGSEKIDKGRR